MSELLYDHVRTAFSSQGGEGLQGLLAYWGEGSAKALFEEVCIEEDVELALHLLRCMPDEWLGSGAAWDLLLQALDSVRRDIGTPLALAVLKRSPEEDALRHREKFESVVKSVVVGGHTAVLRRLFERVPRSLLLECGSSSTSLLHLASTEHSFHDDMSLCEAVLDFYTDEDLLCLRDHRSLLMSFFLTTHHPPREEWRSFARKLLRRLPHKACVGLERERTVLFEMLENDRWFDRVTTEKEVRACVFIEELSEEDLEERFLNNSTYLHVAMFFQQIHVVLALIYKCADLRASLMARTTAMELPLHYLWNKPIFPRENSLYPGCNYVLPHGLCSAGDVCDCTLVQYVAHLLPQEAWSSADLLGNFPLHAACKLHSHTAVPDLLEVTPVELHSLPNRLGETPRDLLEKISPNLNYIAYRVKSAAE